MLKKHLPLILILIFTLVIYWPVTQGEYLVGWDDDQQILKNEDVKNLSWRSIQNYFTTYYVASYQPLASLSFGIEYYFFGENPAVQHYTNLLLHLDNVVLVHFLLRRLFDRKEVVFWLVTAVFAFHPLQTELLGWISTRSTLLCVSFFLLSCHAYVRYLSEDQEKGKYLAYCGTAFVLALLTKSMAVTLPLVLLMID